MTRLRLGHSVRADRQLVHYLILNDRLVCINGLFFVQVSVSFFLFFFCFFVFVTPALSDSDFILLELSQYFVEQHEVEILAACLLVDIPPTGPRFIKKTKTQEANWTDVALAVMRHW